MQTLDLNKMGLAPMMEFEMMEVEGGTADGFNPISFVRDYILGKAIDYAIDAWLEQVERDKSQPNTTYNWNGSATWR